ncbi:MAG: L,D-transpeptidase [Xanthobacteraceae bacterium]|nr:L,D-transpeptidase [Xanthobacteraceae bacterium]
MFAAPALAQDFSVPALDPVTVAQIQGPSVIRAPRYVVEDENERQPRNRNTRRQPQNQQWDENETPPRHYQRQQPVAQYQQQQQPQYYAPQQQPRTDLGGGFIEFLITGNSNPRQRVEQQPQQQYYYPPQQQQQPMYYSRQAPAYQQPMHVARTDPQEQPQRPSFDPRFERTEVEYKSEHPVGSIIIDTRTRYLYLIQPNGRAIRYGVGVGRPGFEWKGVKTVSAMKEWPDWRPPAEMRLRQPYLPEHMPGGPNNPLGARAIYLGSSLYRIHGSNEPHTIGSAVSSGCFRMRNQDVIDLYGRVKVGARVVVL